MRRCRFGGRRGRGGFSGRLGGGFEFSEALAGEGGGAAVAFDAPLELGEGLAAVGGGLAEGKVLVGAVALLVVVLPDLVFRDTEAALEPLAIDEVVDE